MSEYVWLLPGRWPANIQVDDLPESGARISESDELAVPFPEGQGHSIYLEWTGERAGTLVDHEFIAAHFPLPGQYQAYVRPYLTGEAHLPEGLRTYLENL